jgi:hypothetical protein
MNNLRYLSFKKKKKDIYNHIIKRKRAGVCHTNGQKNQDIYQFAIAHLMNGIFFTAIIVIK